MSWFRELINATALFLNVVKRWRLARWEARNTEEEKRLEGERRQLAQLEAMASQDAQHLDQRVRFRSERTHAYWKRRDAVISLKLTLVLENWSVHDVVVEKIWGEVQDSDGPKIGDLSPKLEAFALTHQQSRAVEWDVDWQLSDRNIEALGAGNRRMQIRVRPVAQVRAAEVADIRVTADISQEVKVPK